MKRDEAQRQRQSDREKQDDFDAGKSDRRRRHRADAHFAQFSLAKVVTHFVFHSRRAVFCMYDVSGGRKLPRTIVPFGLF